MRNLIDIIDTVMESKPVGLSAGEIKKYESRFKKFIEYIKNKKPFTTVTGGQVVLDPAEADRFIIMYNNGTFGGSLKAKIKDSENEVALSSLAKTGDFGGAAAAVGQSASAAGKEALLLKPSQIGIVDKNIPAYEFYDMLVSNPVLNSTDYGKEVIKLAEYIVSGEEVVLPPEYRGKDKEKIKKAIVDYAGEYLGVLALLYRRSRFPRRAAFEDWLGGSIDDLVLFFPSKANTNLADSFAIITSEATNHSVNISSKGTGGGAAPAISGLKIPDHMKTNPKYESVLEFVRICKEKGTVEQAFAAIDLLYKTNPSALSEKWLPFLPFSQKSPQLAGAAKESVDAKKNRQEYKLPAKYNKLISDIKSDAASMGGKLIYAIKKEVASAINQRNALPEFKSAILELLQMNFIQQYTDEYGGLITFATQWPAKIDGDITVENKSSATDPTAGGFSFKLGRTDDSVSDELDEPRVDGVDDTEYDDPERKEKIKKNITKVFKGDSEKTATAAPKKTGAGRERRK